MEVSIIIVHHQRIEKLYQQLNEYKKWQNLSDDEFIVVDNSPLHLEDQQKLLEQFPWIKFIFVEKNIGPSAARNIGLKNANGKFIQFVDDDDLITEEKVNGQRKFLTENPAIDVTIGGTQKELWDLQDLPIENPLRILFPAFEEVKRVSDLLKTDGFFQIGSALFKKEILELVNAFDEKKWLVEDVDLYLRLFHAKVRIKVDKNSAFGLFWRVNENNSLSINNRKLFLEGCLSNFLLSITNNDLKFAEDYKIAYSGIYQIFKQDIVLQKQLTESGIMVLNKLSLGEKFRFLPSEVILSSVIGFPQLFKLAAIYRKLKRKIKR